MTLLDILLLALAIGVLVYAVAVPKHRKAAIGAFASALALLGIDVLQRARERRRGEAGKEAATAAATAHLRREAARRAYAKANDAEWDTVGQARKAADDAVAPKDDADPDDVATRFNRKPPGGTR